MHQRIITAPPDCLLIIIYCSPNSCHLFVLSLVSLYLLKILWLNICSVCESIYVYIHIQVIGSEAFIKKKVSFFFFIWTLHFWRGFHGQKLKFSAREQPHMGSSKALCGAAAKPPSSAASPGATSPASPLQPQHRGTYVGLTTAQ